MPKPPPLPSKWSWKCLTAPRPRTDPELSLELLDEYGEALEGAVEELLGKVGDGGSISFWMPRDGED